MTISQNQVSVFLSYAHEDEAWLKKLEKHLSVLQRQEVISVWSDRQIIPGTNWANVIDQRLEQASIILLLVSADFLASDYCYGVEMKRALELQEAGQARVIPIAVRPADWKGAPFAQLQALPTNARAMSTWKNKDEALVNVVTGLRRAIEDLSFSPASSIRTALPPLWTIPYPHNPFFMGRDAVLEELHTQLQTGQATALSQSPYAISGLGGIGKTQIAIEYSYRYYQDYEVVLWVHAESQDALISAYLAIATHLMLPERDAKEQNIIIEAVKAWLQTQRKWLLILDNADHLDLLPPFLPPAPGGHVLITTRAWDMQRLATRLEVETFSNEQGAILLLRRAGLLTSETELAQVSQEDRHWARRLTDDLGGLPLALDQAGAYLEATGISVEEYHHLYQTHRQALLHERRSYIPDHPEAVATTWSLSFSRVQEKDAAAADLLRLCAYFAPDAIAEEILTADPSVLGSVLAPLASDAFRRNHAIETLRAYSLLRRDPGEKMLSMHRLVQAVLQDAMEKKKQYIWAERAMKAINAAFPPAEYGTWQQCERLLMQALTGSQIIQAYQITTSEAGRLLHEVASYLRNRARYAEAEQIYQRALTIRVWPMSSTTWRSCTTSRESMWRQNRCISKHCASMSKAWVLTILMWPLRSTDWQTCIKHKGSMGKRSRSISEYCASMSRA